MSIRDKGGEEEILCLEAISWQRGRGEMDLAENNSPGPFRAFRKVPSVAPPLVNFQRSRNGLLLLLQFSIFKHPSTPDYNQSLLPPFSISRIPHTYRWRGGKYLSRSTSVLCVPVSLYLQEAKGEKGCCFMAFSLDLFSSTFDYRAYKGIFIMHSVIWWIDGSFLAFLTASRGF